MIITEQFFIGERAFVRTRSDSNRYVVRENIEYSEACDPAELNRVYTEGRVIEEQTEIITTDELASILMGET